MDLQTTINEMPYGRIGLLGGVGSGKSYAAGILEFPQVEQVIYLDIARSFVSKIPGKFAIMAVPVLPEDEGKRAALFSRIRHFLQTCPLKKVLFDLVALMVDKKHLKAFSDMLADYLMMWNKKKVALVVDEVPEFLPECGAGYSDKLETIYRVGRNWLVLFILSTAQRPQDAAKAALDTAGVYGIFTQESPRALDAICRLIQDDAAEFKENKARRLMDLPVGAYYLLKMKGRAEAWVDGRR